jgi:hypothetical protein
LELGEDQDEGEVFRNVPAISRRNGLVQSAALLVRHQLSVTFASHQPLSLSRSLPEMITILQCCPDVSESRALLCHVLPRRVRYVAIVEMSRTIAHDYATSHSFSSSIRPQNAGPIPRKLESEGTMPRAAFHSVLPLFRKGTTADQ